MLIAANRDEFHRRRSAAAGPWPQHPDIIAGRDLVAGGTWLGFSTRLGRFALLTNYREPGRLARTNAPSRGALVRDFLLDQMAPVDYIRQIASRAQDWAGFNLIVGDPDQTWYLGNRDPAGEPRRLDPGRYVLSNHLLDTPWPKARRLRIALDGLPPEQWRQAPERVFAILHDAQPAKDAELPATGLPLPRERQLSSPFVLGQDYGTRCSTVVTVSPALGALFAEISYDAAGHPVARHDWRVPPSSLK